jgi:hypothetical protein
VTALDFDTARAEALFASTLSAAEPHEGGVKGCAAVMAAEYGAHPTEAASRMRWAKAAARPLGRRREVASC